MKKLILSLVVAFLLASPALAWKEGPGTNWWYINANGSWKNTVPLVIKLNGDSSPGQTFCIGETITITCTVSAEAVSCAGDGQEAYIESTLSVSGPSGPDSDNNSSWDNTTPDCAYVGSVETRTVSYTVSAPGPHQAYVTSYAAIAQYPYGAFPLIEADEILDALLTFEVLPPSIEKVLISGPEEIGISKPATTPYVFEISYCGPAALIIDTVPAEFEVTGTDPAENGDLDVSPAGKGPKSKSATIITWNVPAGSSTLVVTITTRESPGGGHKLTTFKPTSCEEDMELNDGAMAYQVDGEGNPILDVFGNMIPIVTLEDGSGPLTVDAICGAKPCAPESLTVELVGDDTLSLDWDDVCGGEGVVYNVYRDGVLLNTEPLEDSEYDDTGLTPGDYCYEVEAEYVAQEKHLESDKSDEACGNVPEP